MDQDRIGFIGAGNMANSLIRGLLATGTRPDSLMAADLDEAKLQSLAAETGITACSNEQIGEQAAIIVLAVKPQTMAALCQSLRINAQTSPLVISVAAGITIDNLESWLGADCPVVRCMPNTPALVGKGASGLFANARVSGEQKQRAQAILAAVGLSVWVASEADIDTVTAISGSGPAYFFLLMEAMQDSAERLGLPAELAQQLVCQTAAGAAELASSSEVDLAELRRRVTSPGGTTEAAINRFESGELRQLVDAAIRAAHARSVELAS